MSEDIVRVILGNMTMGNSYSVPCDDLINKRLN